MIAVAETVRGGPAYDKLRPGDILVRVDGKLVTGFSPIEAALWLAVFTRNGSRAVGSSGRSTSIAAAVANVKARPRDAPDRA